MASVRIENLRKEFDGQVVLQLDRLEVRDGEFFSLLGPSGCGKTTTLRCIAGSVEPEEGRIFIGDEDVSRVPTHRRNLGMVFQTYALFPHMTVFENIAYGLNERGISRSEVASRVAESLELVDLEGLQNRYPRRLSGGQQQRVAMARAIVYRPDVLLLDEPLSNLDVKLRISMRDELKRLQQTLGITTIFVTHDQQEALVLSDRIAVMNRGRVEQVGTPDEIYERPATVFVADFVGATNLLSGTMESAGGADGLCRVRLAGGQTVIVTIERALEVGEAVKVAVKPERVRVARGGAEGASLCGVVERVSYLGSVRAYLVRVGEEAIEVRQADPLAGEGHGLATGDMVSLELTSARVLRA